jgi:drug/metabolite transporter (DMT)-like permease
MSLNFVLVVFLSFFIFHDSVNWYKIIGLIIICIGVFIVSRGS